MVNFVKANTNDLKILSDLRKSVWKETYRGIYNDKLIDDYYYDFNMKKDLSRIENSEYRVYLFYIDSIPIGYGYFGIEKDLVYKDISVYISGLYVLKKYKNLGIGTNFFNIVKEFCKERNIHKFFNCCNLHNVKAQGFYEHMGGYIGRIDSSSKDKRNHQIFYEYSI